MPNSLLQKLIRKKYFSINDKKANGSEILHSGDVVSMYLSDETFDKFYELDNRKKTEATSYNIDYKKRIIYECFEKY